MATRPFAIAVAIVAALMGAASAQAATDSSARTGQVRFVKRMTPDFDSVVTNPSQQAWLNAKLWRTEVFTPFFDDKTGGYKQGWVYKDLYSIGNGSDLAKQHPEWILRDAAGNPLYIPWGCANGWCPQYAADITNADYRAWWINGLTASLAKGYKGAWVDDVNLEMRVSDSSGNDATPSSPGLGRAMNAADWRKAMADFTVQIRASVPADKEILHNSIWYAGQGVGRDSNPDVVREINSADYINIERGFNDGGLTGGTGDWSQRALQGFIDRVHAKGKGVILDGFDSSAAGSEYSLANYFLINSGADGVGEISQGPNNWWKGWDTDLGTAQAGRYDWQGLERRDFTGGLVLVNEPQAPAKTVQLPQPMVTTDGRTVTSVTLGGGQGAVLTGVGVTAGTPDAVAGAAKAGTPTKTVSTKTGANGQAGVAASSTNTAADGSACKKVRVTYKTIRWNAKASRFTHRKGSANVCVSSMLKGKAAKVALKQATKKAQRASMMVAKAARLEATTGQAARA